MIWQLILITALVIEAFTIFVRFCFKIKTKDVLMKIMHHYRWKRVFHIHHLFFGLVVAIYAIYKGSSIGLDIGLGIVLSDLIHHFVVMWSIVGNPEFHLVYKNVKTMRKEERNDDRKIRRFFRKAFSWF